MWWQWHNNFFPLARLGQQVRNTWKVLECGAGEGWRRSVASIMLEMKKKVIRVKEQRNILHEISKRKANWIGHILRRKCSLKLVVEGKIKGGIEVTGRRGRRRRKPLDYLKERRGYSHLKEKALDLTMWRSRSGRGFGPVVRQTAK
jgi:hypothetical protein